MGGAAKMGLWQFSVVYLLLLIVLFIMKKSQISQTKLLLLASVRMTVQLVLAGFILQYIFSDPKPIYTVLFISGTVVFSIYRVLSMRKDLNTKFKVGIAVSLALSGLSVLAFFVCVVTGQSFFNPQYTIPLAGMIIGNSMTGVSLGVKNFLDSIGTQKKKIETMINLGLDMKTILKPFVNQALESALLPTLNSMLGMGIIFLPGMMTGQILSGTMPTTAILYQIAIMIAICTSVCLTTFFALSIGYKSLYNSRQQYTG